MDIGVLPNEHFLESIALLAAEVNHASSAS